MPPTPIELLLVEDNPGDARLVREAFREARVLNTLHVVQDGERAMEYLHRTGDFRDAVVPDIVLLDLNLPRKSGAEVLAEIKGDPSLRHIPVIIMTSSDDEREVMSAYTAQANCFLTKPLEIDRFMQVMQLLEGFWLTVVRLPRPERN